MTSAYKHLPRHQWPEADIEAFRKGYLEGDPFDGGGGGGSHWTKGTRLYVETAYRRWLGFLDCQDPSSLALCSEDRIDRSRVRSFIEHLQQEVRSTTVCLNVEGLLAAAQMIAPERDWRWLKRVVRGLAAQAKPEDRFNRLVAPYHTLNLGLHLMDACGDDDCDPVAANLIRYRDGMMIALLSLWPIRRRSLTCLTLSHLRRLDDTRFVIALRPEDTKSKRQENFVTPDLLSDYLHRYLAAVRPRLLGIKKCDALWVSCRGTPLSSSAIYNIVRDHVAREFGREMGLHDFRRAAATFIATDQPEKVGLIPGVLQHASPDVGEKHYNLARSTEASRRFNAVVLERRSNSADD
jgi:integrase/recombinase XerD